MYTLTTCSRAHGHVGTYSHMYIYIHVRTYTSTSHACTCTYTHIHTYIYISTHTHAHTHKQTNTSIQTHKHRHIHTYKDTHTQSHTQPLMSVTSKQPHPERTPSIPKLREQRQRRTGQILRVLHRREPTPNSTTTMPPCHHARGLGFDPRHGR